ncbi:glycosyltransferase family 4 protein [Microbacterium sp. J1-1]|uniref:glycosyltransferase family 4 protein n=1 Tax=Microbacterium sp. J1-1 TaxID=2992441 RepID=UPI002114F214|nr:glycosyltransferase family 4 protein [Microbacterium sp. J1-1]UUE21475.1 glycosyltransferase family 4 protein [Microbacterium sp. J1-1]
MVTSSVTATTFLRGYLRFLREAGWDVTLVCDDGPGVIELAGASGVRYEPLHMEREPSPLEDARSLVQCARLLRRLRPDVLVYATPKASLIGAVAGWLVRVPGRNYELWGLRLETSAGFSRRLFALLERLTMVLSSRVIANSASLAQRVSALGLNGGREVFVLGAGSSHGVDTERYSEEATMPDLDADVKAMLQRSPAPIVGFVGRLHPDKGVDTLIDALRICSQRSVAAQLLVVGAQEGVTLDTGIEGPIPIPVHAAGFTQEVRPLLRAMDILVLPSRREGFPNVVLEAGAMKVPAIVSDATGCVDAVIDGVTGVVTPVGDAHALASALETLLTDPDRRESMGAAARAWSEEAFVPTAVWRLHSDCWAGEGGVR